MSNVMKFSDQKTAAQMLLDAIAYDLQVLAELEQSDQLFEGYHPKMRAIHEQNAQLLTSFIEQYGWPLPSKYGTNIHEAAWMIAIHAISKPQLLKSTLQLLEQALHNGEPVAQEYAKLFDRIALYEGRQQRYGTQFAPSPTGWQAWDLENPEQVDIRRANLGLSTFLEGKRECGAVDDGFGGGGFIDVTTKERYEANYLIFLKEVGWRS